MLIPESDLLLASPPFRKGAFGSLVPHATLGTWGASRSSDEPVARARELTREVFPLSCAVEDVALLEEHAPNRWRELRRLPLGVS